jgi:hypothetical protein
MLQTCSEAREVVLGSFNEIPDCGFKIAYPVYLSTEDILYFGRLNELEDFASRGCGDCVRESGVRRVAVWLNYMQGMSDIDIISILTGSTLRELAGSKRLIEVLY